MLLCIGLHWTKALPDIPVGHAHIGMWLTTSHKAFSPHVPGQGSLHLFLMQALSFEQSEFKTHSGRHPSYGFPK